MDPSDTTTDPIGPNSAAREHRRTRIRRTLASVSAVLVLAGLVLVVTSFTGFPGPGPVRRYRTSELQDLVRRIEHPRCAGASFADPDGTTWTYGAAPPATASVDRLRSRVHLDQPFGIDLSEHDWPMVDNPGSSAPRGQTGCYGVHSSPIMG